MTAADLLESDRFAAALMGVRLVEAAEDRLVVEMDLGPGHFDRSGSVAAGVLFSLADCAMSLMSNRNRQAVAVATHLTRFGDGSGATSLRAEAVVGSPGIGRATTWQASVSADGARIAAFTGTTLAVGGG
ncbi:MAG: PaaI family thioesterase [Acidimicrobiia bacterium]